MKNLEAAASSPGEVNGFILQLLLHHYPLLHEESRDKVTDTRPSPKRPGCPAGPSSSTPAPPPASGELRN